MVAGLQSAGRPAAVINDSDSLDLTHSITLCLTHHQLIYHTDTWQPHPRLPQPRTRAMLSEAPDNILTWLSATPQPEVALSSYSYHHCRCWSTGLSFYILNKKSNHCNLEGSLILGMGTVGRCPPKCSLHPTKKITRILCFTLRFGQSYNCHIKIIHVAYIVYACCLQIILLHVVCVQMGHTTSS